MPGCALALRTGGDPAHLNNTGRRLRRSSVPARCTSTPRQTWTASLHCSTC